MNIGKLNLIQESLKSRKSVMVTLEGNSMWPLISDKTRVPIRQTHFNIIKISDIIAFRKGSEMCVHQCIHKKKDHLITWGVNNNMPDRGVDRSCVLGTVSLTFNTNLFHHLLLMEAGELNKLLIKVNVNPIWMKGPIYGLYLYGYFLNTKMPDLDVLIDRKKFINVKRVLESIGYKQKEKKESTRTGLPYKEVSFIKTINDLKICLDVHLIAVRCTFQKIFPQPLEPERMIALNNELIKKPIKFKGFLLMNDTSSLIHLCLNLVFHHASRGIWEHVRIAKLIEKGDINWHRFQSILKEFQLTNYVYFPLLWSKRMFGTKLVGLDYFKPSPLKLWLCKLAINKYVVGRQIHLDGKGIKGWVNNGIIFYIKIVLHSFLPIPSKYKE